MKKNMRDKNRYTHINESVKGNSGKWIKRRKMKDKNKNKRKQKSLLGVTYFFYQMVSIISLLIINDYANMFNAY